MSKEKKRGGRAVGLLVAWILLAVAGGVVAAADY